MSFKVCMSFKVGDRVQHESFGLGTVIGFYLRKDDWPCIEYDKGQHHSGNGDIYPKPKHTPSNRCYFTEPSGLELISHKEETVSKYKVGDVVPEHLYAGITPMTFEKHPEEKIGNLYVLTEPGGSFSRSSRGTVVRLYKQNNSRCPGFAITTGVPTSSQWHYANWGRVTPLSAITNQSKENKPMETRNERRTFKLVKAMPGIKVGTLFQEECEDGTQPYSPMDGQPSEVNISFRDRSLVEDSKFFEEVWKVEPQFMTRAELDRFEAFKKLPKGKKPAKVAKTKKTAKKAPKKAVRLSKNGKRLGRPPKAGK